MAKKVWVTVRSVQRDADGNEEVMETAAEGLFSEKNGSSYLFYEEKPEGEPEAIKNVMKRKGNLLELTRRGAINTRMVFEQGRTYMADYVTPYCRLRFGVRTERLSCLSEEDTVEIRADYELTLDGEPLSRCEVIIKASRL